MKGKRFFLSAAMLLLLVSCTNPLAAAGGVAGTSNAPVASAAETPRPRLGGRQTRPREDDRTGRITYLDQALHSGFVLASDLLAEAKHRYTEDAPTNKIKLDQPLYTNAACSELRLRAAATTPPITPRRGKRSLPAWHEGAPLFSATGFRRSQESRLIHAPNPSSRGNTKPPIVSAVEPSSITRRPHVAEAGTYHPTRCDGGPVVLADEDRADGRRFCLVSVGGGQSQPAELRAPYRP